MTDPNGSGWVPNDFITDLLGMRAALYAAFHFGPYAIYVGPGWDAFLDEDYSSAKGDITLRERAEKTPKLGTIQTADFLANPYDVVMFEKNQDTIRGVTGMPLTPLTWETQGGLEINGKIMGIMIPNLGLTTTVVAALPTTPFSRSVSCPCGMGRQRGV